MKKILFVCHGNICRSTMAEFVMKDMVAKAGLMGKSLWSRRPAARMRLAVTRIRGRSGCCARIACSLHRDTIMAGLIIFPACFAYGVDPASGSNLLFISLPNVFNAMPLGRLWGTMFFLFMTFASMSTVIAVFENLIVCFFELLQKDRRTIIRWGIPVIILLSLPCVLGFNVWSGFQPLIVLVIFVNGYYALFFSK